MDYPAIAEAKREWLDSPEGREAANAETLPRTPDADQYLKNRLERAFDAGIRAMTPEPRYRKRRCRAINSNCATSQRPL
jgi:hypothetical protein